MPWLVRNLGRQEECGPVGNIDDGKLDPGVEVP